MLTTETISLDSLINRLRKGKIRWANCSRIVVFLRSSSANSDTSTPTSIGSRVKKIPSRPFWEHGFTRLWNAPKRDLKTEIATIEDEESIAKEAAISLAAKDGVSRFFGKDHVLTTRDDLDVEYPKSGDDRREAFEDALRDMNLLDEVSSVNGISLRALVKKSGWLESMPEQLAPFVKTEHSKTARLGRRKDKEEK